MVETRIGSDVRVIIRPVASMTSSTNASHARGNSGNHVPAPPTRSFERAATVPSDRRSPPATLPPPGRNRSVITPWSLVSTPPCSSTALTIMRNGVCRGTILRGGSSIRYRNTQRSHGADVAA